MPRLVNNRIAHGTDDKMRADVALLGVVGKRLTYDELTGKLADDDKLSC